MTTALDLNEPYSSAELKKVASVEFGILSPQQTIAQSVCKVDTGNIYVDGVLWVEGMMMMMLICIAV